MLYLEIEGSKRKCKVNLGNCALEMQQRATIETYLKGNKKGELSLKYDSFFRDYLMDIECITNIEIKDNQRSFIRNELKTIRHNRLSNSEAKRHRSEFVLAKKKLISEWEVKTAREWPKYTENVVSDKGKVLRRLGENYDIHHIIELCCNGPNEWWNVHPALFPHQHQNKIHRRGGYADILFGK